jgi:hypothetical protein
MARKRCPNVAGRVTEAFAESRPEVELTYISIRWI